MHLTSMYLFSLKRPCGSLKVIVQQTWLGDVRSVTPSTSETGTTGELLHRSPELSPLVYYVLEYLWVVYVTLWLCDSWNVCCNTVVTLLSWCPWWPWWAVCHPRNWNWNKSLNVTGPSLTALKRTWSWGYRPYGIFDKLLLPFSIDF